MIQNGLLYLMILTRFYWFLMTYLDFFDASFVNNWTLRNDCTWRFDDMIIYLPY